MVRDMDESLAFYCDILDYRIVVEKRVTDATSIETMGLDGHDGFRLIYLIVVILSIELMTMHCNILKKQIHLV